MTKLTSELIRLVKLNDTEAFDALLQRYGPMIETAVGHYARFIGSGGGLDDLNQEAAIALYQAARTFRDGMGVTFGLYAKICVHNRLKTVLRKLQSNYEPYEKIRLTASNPESGYIAAEDYRRLRKKLELLLTEYERRVLLMYLEGRSYRAIASACGRDEKSVDNALRRIRRKLRASDG